MLSSCLLLMSLVVQDFNFRRNFFQFLGEHRFCHYGGRFVTGAKKVTPGLMTRGTGHISIRSVEETRSWKITSLCLIKSYSLMKSTLGREVPVDPSTSFPGLFPKPWERGFIAHASLKPFDLIILFSVSVAITS